MPTLKGNETSLSYGQYFLYLISSSIKVFILHGAWLDTSGQTLCLYNEMSFDYEIEGNTDTRCDVDET